MLHTRRQIRIVQTINLALSELHTSDFFWVGYLNYTLHIFSESVRCFLSFYVFFFLMQTETQSQIPSCGILLMCVSPGGVAHEIYRTDFCVCHEVTE